MFFWAFFGPLVRLLTEVGLLIVWGVGASLIYRDEITVGILSSFFLYIARFYGKTESIILMVKCRATCSSFGPAHFEILDRVPSVPEPVKPYHPGKLEGRIELKDVRFKYGTREVLHGLNLKIEPNEMIGLVGPSGASKSTLVNLVCRFYDVAEGAILVDGHDTRSFPVSEYRQNIGIVLQDPFLFFGTIAENIAYGKPNASARNHRRRANGQCTRIHFKAWPMATIRSSVNVDNLYPGASDKESRSLVRF